MSADSPLRAWLAFGAVIAVAAIAVAIRPTPTSGAPGTAPVLAARATFAAAVPLVSAAQPPGVLDRRHEAGTHVRAPRRVPAVAEVPGRRSEIDRGEAADPLAMTAPLTPPSALPVLEALALGAWAPPRAAAAAQERLPGFLEPGWAPRTTGSIGHGLRAAGGGIRTGLSAAGRGLRRVF